MLLKTIDGRRPFLFGLSFLTETVMVCFFAGAAILFTFSLQSLFRFELKIPQRQMQTYPNSDGTPQILFGDIPYGRSSLSNVFEVLASIEASRNKSVDE